MCDHYRDKCGQGLVCSAVFLSVGVTYLNQTVHEIVTIPFLLQISGQTSLHIQHKNPSFPFMAFMNLPIVRCESKPFSFASWPLVFSGAPSENMDVGALGPSWWSRPHTPGFARDSPSRVGLLCSVDTGRGRIRAVLCKEQRHFQQFVRTARSLSDQGRLPIVFPSGSAGKESTCRCRRLKRCGFNPWVGTIPQRRKRQPTPVFLPGRFHGQRSLAGYSPCGRKELDPTEHTCLPQSKPQKEEQGDPRVHFRGPAAEGTAPQRGPAPSLPGVPLGCSQDVDSSDLLGAEGRSSTEPDCSLTSIVERMGTACPGQPSPPLPSPRELFPLMALVPRPRA